MLRRFSVTSTRSASIAILLALSFVLIALSVANRSARAAQQELAYDDGTPEFYFGCGPGCVAAVKFNVPERTRVLRLRFGIQGEQNAIRVHVLDANFNSIYSQEVMPRTGWLEVDISRANVYVVGDFFVGFQWLIESPDGPWLGDDNSSPPNPRSYLGTPGSNPGLAPNANEHYLIRAIVESGGDPCQLDSDRDGVPDCRDRCPNTPPGSRVDENGCPAQDPCQMDSDRDGVPDCRDRCPNTPPGTRVDENGCPVASAPFIRDWLLCGSFTFGAGNAQSAFNSDYISEIAVQPSTGEACGGKTWRSHHSPEDFINFDSSFSPNDYAVAYAHVYVNSPRTQAVQLRVGSDDAIKVWLNGRLVHENFVNRGHAKDQDIKTVTLNEGWNRLLIKVLDWIGGWGFYARFTNTDGSEVQGLTYQLDNSTPSRRDSDGDGIPDDQDRCPDQPGPRENNGCPDPCQMDSDRDGVPDCRDRCTNTPPGTRVDENGCPVQGREKPDLIIEDITWSPEHPAEGDTVTINIKVKNQGSGNAGSFYVSFYVGGTYYEKKQISGLSAGATTTASFTGDASKWAWIKQCDVSHSVKAIADFEKQVDESNESNNEYIKTVRIACRPQGPGVVVLDASTIQIMTNVTANEIHFSASTPLLDRLKAGDIIVLGITDKTPYGLLRKVEGISRARGIILKTKQARLVDAISQGSISGCTPRAELVHHPVEVVLYEGKVGKVTMTGELTISVELCFKLEIEGGRIKHITFKAKATQEADFRVEAENSVFSQFLAQKELFRHYFQPITVIIPVPVLSIPIPVVFTPVLTVEAGVTAKLWAGMMAGVKQVGTFEAGFSYDDFNIWKPITDYKITFTPYGPTRTPFDSQMRAFVRPALSLLVYGVTGPYISVEAYFDFETLISIDFKRHWRLCSGLDVDGGVNFDALFDIVNLPGLAIAKLSRYKLGFSCIGDSQSPIVITSTCPVDLVVTDPDGLVVNKQSSQIPEATYTEKDLNGDGDPDDQIVIPNRKIGDYQVRVIPEPRARPTDTYTLEISVAGETSTVADEVQIKDIPDRPYTFTSKEVALSIEEAIDENDNGIIDDPEILRALRYWISGEEVPGTGGQTIDDAKMLELLHIWTSRRPISSSSTQSGLIQAGRVESLTVREIKLSPNLVKSIHPATFRAEGSGIARIKVEVFNLAGMKVSEEEASGNTLRFYALDDRSRSLANGVYLYVVTVRGSNGEAIRSDVRKLVILR